VESIIKYPRKDKTTTFQKKLAWREGRNTSPFLAVIGKPKLLVDLRKCENPAFDHSNPTSGIIRRSENRREEGLFVNKKEEQSSPPPTSERKLGVSADVVWVDQRRRVRDMKQRERSQSATPNRQGKVEPESAKEGSRWKQLPYHYRVREISRSESEDERRRCRPYLTFNSKFFDKLDQKGTKSNTEEHGRMDAEEEVRPL